MVVPFLFSWIYFVLLPGTAIGNGLYVLAKIMLVVWPVLATRWILRERLTFGLVNDGGGSARWKIVLGGLGLGLVVLAIMVVLLASPLGEIVREGAESIRIRVQGMGVLDHFFVFALFLSVVHSLIEEVYWRWFVFGNLRRLTRKTSTAHVAAAVGFSAHHIVVLSQFFTLGMAVFLGICVGIGGFLWSWLYARQGTLLGAWLSHMVVDFGIMAVGARLMGLL